MLYNNLNIELLEHSTVRITDIQNQKILYIDPYKLSKEQDYQRADYLLISHSHQDHCNLEDFARLIGPQTHVITVADCQSKVIKARPNKVTILAPNKATKNDYLTIQATHAYNTNKPFHPKENEWVGFIITINNTRIYFAADTDVIPEMQNIQNIDIAFLPASGTYVMTPQEAAQAVNIIKPKIAVPMHYGCIVGSKEDAQLFKQLAQTMCQVELLK